MFWDEKPKRKSGPTKTEWDAQKKMHRNSCVICHKTEKVVGKLEKAHIKARSRGGTQVVPMCRNHHYKYDHGMLSATELKRIGLTKDQVSKLKPKTPRRTRGWFDL
jgi:predicted restriction endonuclease